MQFRPPPPPQVREPEPSATVVSSDRGCPLDTAGDRCLWHAGGTAGENDEGRTWPRRPRLDCWVRPVRGDHCLVGKPRRRRGSSFPLGHESFEHCSWRCSPAPRSPAEMNVCCSPPVVVPARPWVWLRGFVSMCGCTPITAKRECSFVSPQQRAARPGRRRSHYRAAATDLSLFVAGGHQPIGRRIPLQFGSITEGRAAGGLPLGLH
jgi:hypothetical protein